MKKMINCKECNGHYVVRESEYGVFAGCSNFPKCKSKMKLHELVGEFILKYGLGIYKWEKNCWKCSKGIPVFSYYLGYELENLDEYFSYYIPAPGIGVLTFIDRILLEKYSTIQIRYSKTTDTNYIANVCPHCNSLQGYNYVVEDPHEIFINLFHQKNMEEKFLLERILVKDVKPILQDLKEFYDLPKIMKIVLPMR